MLLLLMLAFAILFALSTQLKFKQDILNNKKQNTPLLPTGNTFEQQKAIDLQKAIKDSTKSSNPKFHRTESEEELADRFFIKHYSEIEKLEGDVYDNVKAVHSSTDINDKIKQCEKAMESYDTLKRFCCSKGKGGLIYFDDMWEHCHNSRNADFRFIEETEKMYLYLTKNYAEAKASLIMEQKQKELKDTFLANGRKELLAIIKANEGVLQKDLYKHFDPILRGPIQSIVRELANEGIIIRLKKGSTYKLYCETLK